MSHPVNGVPENMVSIIVPCYNYGNYLQQTVASVQVQGYANWECIIIDDGSTDNTKQVGEDLALKDARIKYHFQKNQGLSVARNNGIVLARGTYIQLLDADDLLFDDKFLKQLNCFKENDNVDIVYGNYQLMDESGTRKWKNEENWITVSDEPFKDFLLLWEKGLTIPIHAYLFKKTCFDQWGSFNATLPTHEDVDLQLRFAFNGARYQLLNEDCCYYRVHAKSMARNYTLMHKGYLMVLLSFMREQNTGIYVRLLLMHRYWQEFFNALLTTVRGKENNFAVAINNKGAFVLNLSGFVLSPFYLLLKLAGKLSR